jgi:exopolysaccharide biosynthesis polyprenyl glycosylphosphotransferase
MPWFSPPLDHRIYALGLVLLTTVSLISWRVLYTRVFVHTAFSLRGIVVGSGMSALKLAHAINQIDEQEKDDADDTSPYIGYELVGRVVDGVPDTRDDDIPVIGDMRKLVYLARQHEVHEIILAPEDDSELSPETLEILLDCRELGFRVSNLASVYERLTGRLPVEYANYNLQLLLSPADSPVFRLHQATKRVMDVLLSIIGLLLLGLVLPFVALGNALTSPGPLFYRQERMGKGGRPFTLVKLRSMSLDAECSSGGAVWCGDNDPRITPVGRFLRKTRLDEVPQLVNVLRGEMSLVGPRPERPHFVGELARTFPLYRARHAIKPGVTGWAQVKYEYGNSVEDARNKLEYDLYYVKHTSFYLDFLILLHTVRTIIGMKGQ